MSIVQKKQEEATEQGDRVPTIGSKRDPLRFVALSKLPHISNLHSNNCFINSVLQLLKHTGIEETFSHYQENPIVNVMMQLNNVLSSHTTHVLQMFDRILASILKAQNIAPRCGESKKVVVCVDHFESELARAQFCGITAFVDA